MTFTPTRVTITGITNANPAVVTCSSAHNLTTGQVIRLNIPKAYGMQEANNILAQITNLSSLTFSLQFKQSPPAINVDSTNFAPFINAGTGTPAAFLAVGSGATPITNTTPQATNNFCDSLLGDATINNSTSEIPF